MPSDFYSNSVNAIKRHRQNKRLSASDPRWRIKAGGGRGLYRKLREARNLAESDPRAATRLNALEQRAKAFQANRKQLISPTYGEKGGSEPRPVVPPTYRQKTTKRKRFSVS